MTKKTVFTFLLLAMRSSCKKERLDGEYFVLIGKWELAYVVKKKVYTNSGNTVHDTTFAINIPDQYAFEFLE